MSSNSSRKPPSKGELLEKVEQFQPETPFLNRVARKCRAIPAGNPLPGPSCSKMSSNSSRKPPSKGELLENVEQFPPETPFLNRVARKNRVTPAGNLLPGPSCSKMSSNSSRKPPSWTELLEKVENLKFERTFQCFIPTKPDRAERILIITHPGKAVFAASDRQLVHNSTRKGPLPSISWQFAHNSVRKSPLRSVLSAKYP
jgi:hypothetical protein